MVLIPQWRQLIYKLADKYPSCTMLNFAIKVSPSLSLSSCLDLVQQSVCVLYCNRGFLTKDIRWRLPR